MGYNYATGQHEGPRRGAIKIDPRVNKTSYLPSIPDNDFEAFDQQCIEQVRRMMPGSVTKRSGVRNQTVSLPELHARHESRIPSLGQSSTASSIVTSPHLSKHDSAPTFSCLAKGRTTSFDLGDSPTLARSGSKPSKP